MNYCGGSFCLVLPLKSSFSSTVNLICVNSAVGAVMVNLFTQNNFSVSGLLVGEIVAKMMF